MGSLIPELKLGVNERSPTRMIDTLRFVVNIRDTSSLKGMREQMSDMLQLVDEVPRSLAAM